MRPCRPGCFKLRRRPREPHLELRVPDVFVVAVAELPRPVGGPRSRVAVAVRQRLSIPPEHLASEAQQLESAMPGMIDVDNEQHLSALDALGSDRQASGADMLAPPGPPRSARGRNLLGEQDELIDVSLRERHSPGIRHSEGASCAIQAADYGRTLPARRVGSLRPIRSPTCVREADPPAIRITSDDGSHRSALGGDAVGAEVAGRAALE